MTNPRIDSFPDIYRDVFIVLAPSIGDSPAEKVIELIGEMFGGQIVYFQKNDKFKKQERNTAIIDAFDEGMSTRDVGIKFHVTAEFARSVFKKKGLHPILSYFETLSDNYRELFIKTSEALGEKTAETVVMLFSEYFGSQSVYFPMADCLYKSRRNEEIAAAFNGRNIRELSRRYGVSRNHIYEILRAYRKQRQLSLFETSPNSN